MSPPPDPLRFIMALSTSRWGRMVSLLGCQWHWGLGFQLHGSSVRSTSEKWGGVQNPNLWQSKVAKTESVARTLCKHIEPRNHTYCLVEVWQRRLWGVRRRWQRFSNL